MKPPILNHPQSQTRLPYLSFLFTIIILLVTDFVNRNVLVTPEQTSKICINNKLMFSIEIASTKHLAFTKDLHNLYKEAAKEKNTGLAIRTVSYLESKIKENKAIIACLNDKLVGFCYIESWEHEKYTANSGLIVKEEYRDLGIAGKIKAKAKELCIQHFPNSKIFGLTTSLAVMRINSELGYVPVTYSELTKDESFWEGCTTCPNYDILTRTKRTSCLCTAMISYPEECIANSKEETKQFSKQAK